MNQDAGSGRHRFFFQFLHGKGHGRFVFMVRKKKPANIVPDQQVVNHNGNGYTEGDGQGQQHKGITNTEYFDQGDAHKGRNDHVHDVNVQ